MFIWNASRSDIETECGSISITKVVSGLSNGNRSRNLQWNIIQEHRTLYSTASYIQVSDVPSWPKISVACGGIERRCIIDISI